ncbi:DUF1622 domain-containing protein [Geitlerinema sp. PCC 7407]|uniref:DUF1622 domain-containing protein n=1 Tax=Geitlerinema sp. PCC 7407 TaxID=1173025 RepID=UPI00029FBF97|nr:DUF1622 domain-containing protein [Geitlerinema sp. PCC 7407]AFY67663.1 protein of unknown function DUF1622 [Geitlerinema sp. PCC 7407]
MDFAAHTIAKVIEVIGILVTLGGGAIATSSFLRHLWRRERFEDLYPAYRSNLGRAILLGLEFLVAADIIGTVSIDPTFESLGSLGMIVLIRTFLSFSLEVEINGRWPWEEGDRHSRQETL